MSTGVGVDHRKQCQMCHITPHVIYDIPIQPRGQWAHVCEDCRRIYQRSPLLSHEGGCGHKMANLRSGLKTIKP